MGQLKRFDTSRTKSEIKTNDNVEFIISPIKRANNL